MPQIDFPALFNKLLSGVKSIAEQNAKDYVTEAVRDGTGILDELRVQLEVWATQLAGGELTKDEFEYQLGSAKDLLEMVALKQKGLAQVQVDKFKNAVFDLILETVSVIIP